VFYYKELKRTILKDLILTYTKILLALIKEIIK